MTDLEISEFMAREAEAYAQLCSEIDGKYAWEMIESPAMLRRLFNSEGWPVIHPIWVDLGQVSSGAADLPALRIVARASKDGPCGEDVVLLDTDPVEDLIWGHSNFDGEPVPLDDEARTQIHRAIAALQSGIDRLRAFEAACDTAK